MKRIVCAVMLIVIAFAGASRDAHAQAKKPNILVIWGDAALESLQQSSGK